MKVSESCHAIHIPFKIPVGPALAIDRFVYAFVILGEEICLIDSGVAASSGVLFNYIRKSGRSPGDISQLVLTHSHPDHMGGAASIVKAAKCRTAAHAAEKAWIEDTELQFRERPIPGFHALVEGPVGIDTTLEDGYVLDLAGRELLAIHTPGHSAGSVSLFYPSEGVLISGDVVPVWGGLPVYEDVIASVRSLKKLQEIGNIECLLSSWDEPRRGADAYERIENGLKYIQRIHDTVRKEQKKHPSHGAEQIAAAILKDLGFPPVTLGPIMTTVKAHLAVSAQEDLLA